MQACTRCGVWHTDAEKYAGHYLSCSEVKAYWGEVALRHKEAAGHVAQIRIRKDGRVVCMKCNQDLTEHL